MYRDLSALCVISVCSIREVIAAIDRNERGIVLVVDEDSRLLDTVTDGDIRRAVLAGVNLDAPVGELLSRRATSPYPEPVIAKVDTERHDLMRLMKQHHLRHIPIVDDTRRVMGLVTIDELLPTEVLPVQAVVMAGGFGTRLRPLTNDMPKPMLPVGGRPLMELIIDQLRSSGIQQVHIATHHKADKIVEHFGDGKAFGVNLAYLNEDRPLGTAGALGLLAAPKDPFLVINGDILTGLDFRAMVAFHRDHQAELTVAVRKYDIKVPYGVIESDGTFVKALVEKPTLDFFVNAGIYLLEPSVHHRIPAGQRFDMTELIHLLLAEGHRVASFPVIEYWLDIGKHVDYQQAQEDVKNGRLHQCRPY